MSFASIYSDINLISLPPLVPIDALQITSPSEFISWEASTQSIGR